MNGSRAMAHPLCSYTPADHLWAHEVADALITATLAIALEDDPSGAAPLYEAARTQALEVRDDDGHATERLFLAMSYVASRTAGLVMKTAAQEGMTPEELWQKIARGRIQA